MTNQQIREEILKGPLANEIKPYLSMVFNDVEPIRTKLEFRQGMLTPDGAFEILRILNDPTKRPKTFQSVNQSEFANIIYPLLLKVASLPQSQKDYWMMLIKMATENNVSLDEDQIVEIIKIAKKDNILTDQIENSLKNLIKDGTQSRLEELGWNLSNEDVQLATKSVSKDK